MKRFTLLFLISLNAWSLCAQNKVDITAVIDASGNPSTTTGVKDNRKIKVKPGVTVNSFDLSLPTPLTANQKLIVDCAGATLNAAITNEYTSGIKTFTYTSDITNKQITLNLEDAGTRTVYLKFMFTRSASVPSPVVNPTAAASGLAPSLQGYLNSVMSNYKQTKFGFVDASSDDEDVHIFFNQHGNPLLGTIPQGISNKSYVIHIIYLGYSNKPDDVDYSVKQKSGAFNSSLVLNNTGILNNVSNFQAAEVKQYDQWHEKTFRLSTSTDDISFDILATTEDDDGKPIKVTLDSYTIKMSPVYHGTFDIGLFNTNLVAPTYSLVQDPSGSGASVVKKSDDGPHGVVTVMASLYTSPVIAVEKLLSSLGIIKTKIPAYKLSGRNFLDDHKFLERIYPAIGVGVNNKAFENLFFGFNWEIARGLSVFGGKHYAKINTFTMPGFVPGVTQVTQSQFDYYSNTKWDSDWAVGAQLDIMIINNLFKK